MQSRMPNSQVLAQMGLDVEDYEQLIGNLYDGALDTRRVAEALRQLQGLFQANIVTLILRAVDEPYLSPMLAVGEVNGAGEIQHYAYYSKSTPFNNLPLDQVFTIDDLMTEAEWLGSSFYLLYCQPYGCFQMLGADISMPDGGKLRIRINRRRDQPKFSDSERALCAMLLPHLRRALHLHAQLDRSESLGSLYFQAISRLSVATIVLDESGSVLQLNPVARDILDSNDGLKLVGGRLEATYPSDNRELSRLVRDAFQRARQGDIGHCNAAALSISRPSGQVNLGVVVELIPSQDWVEGKGQPTVVVYVRDAVGKSLVSNLATAQLYNLTPAETGLAMELANGLSLEEASEVLNIRRNTARAHLRSIFSKTGVRRQTELVRILLNSVVALGPPGALPPAIKAAG
ncbi:MULTISPECIES: helix-turn-helix transcriptional regulator [Pseudomonas]|uniref:Helix-turn-helix transcriptional regulator n=1 Tax=Pseudomonas sp. Hg7Tf TaxID=3236988 RepID=A0AB39I1E0_9PSED|nr:MULTISPECIES: helix-turn-helix transcriptional regulator [Pseudomonas]KJK07297.1 LuxR family transcriptional regulator [Pseudomonas sp. 5]MDD1977702.1 helix-turn-helix transcriptional regulator [Pseudomonas putida]MDH2561579.1 helix-turn-helix transcriptional regulator [Pseudomonas sp. Hg5Tf]QYX48651.1 helix-turn-helix transcriptional regulator [Pseudomonas sp. S11A 273]